MTWMNTWPSLLAIIIVIAVMPIAALYMTFLERKIAAWVQDRVGPNRVGPAGAFQAIADAVKIMLKEQVIPDHVNRGVYFVAPAISVFTATFALCVVPFGPVPLNSGDGVRYIIAPHIDTGLMFLFSIASLSAYGIILGGWASNNKYSLYGAVRSCAQFLSYEIPLGLSVLGVVATSGTLNIETIVHHQSSGWFGWNIWWQPLGAILFFVSALAETNRLPFDLPECEQELVGGFHTEYSGIKFVMFFLAENIHVVTVSILTVLLFFGGWHFPGLESQSEWGFIGFLLRFFVVYAKVMAVIFFIMLLRWTLPRFRFDQLMGLAWKGMIPLGLLNFFGVVLAMSFGWPLWTLAVVSTTLVFAAGWINVGRARSAVARRAQMAHDVVIGVGN